MLMTPNRPTIQFPAGTLFKTEVVPTAMMSPWSRELYDRVWGCQVFDGWLGLVGVFGRDVDAVQVGHVGEGEHA